MTLEWFMYIVGFLLMVLSVSLVYAKSRFNIKYIPERLFVRTTWIGVILLGISQHQQFWNMFGVNSSSWGNLF